MTVLPGGRFPRQPQQLSKPHSLCNEIMVFLVFPMIQLLADIHPDCVSLVGSFKIVHDFVFVGLENSSVHSTPPCEWTM